jgi:peptidoglycan/xylan/chitin deacetylase (PgdA/CDA1 family)
MKKLRFTFKKSLLILLVLAVILITCIWFSPFQTRIPTEVGIRLNITSISTDKPVYQKYGKVVFRVQIKNTGDKQLPGAWVDVWIDKMPISILNKNPFYHDIVYNQLMKSFGCLTAYMPDPNPVNNPVLNNFIPGPIYPGQTKDIQLSYHTTGEYTRIQSYTVKVYAWNPVKGRNLNGIIANKKSAFGELDLKQGEYAQEGVKALSAYPHGERAALVVRIDDVSKDNSQEIKQIVAVLDKHKAKGTFLLLADSAANCREELIKALISGHEIGIHGTDHQCVLPKSEHIPETLTTGQESPPYWHEFEGPHFRSNGYYYQYKRMKSTYDEIVTNLGIRPVTFCAPQVGMSEVTLKVAKDLGIKFSSNFVGDKAEYAYVGVIEVPYVGDYTWGVSPSNYASTLEAAEKDLNRISSKGGVMLMVIHTIRMNSLRYKWIDDFLAYTDTKKLWYAPIRDVGNWYQKSAKKPVPLREIPGGLGYLAKRR